MRPLRQLATIVALGLALAGVARGDEPVTLQRKLVVGARVKVDEQRSNTYQVSWKGPGAKVGDVKTTEVVRVYTEEVRRAEPELLVRTFERSTRSEHHPRSAPDPVNTSLHGRRLLVAGLERRPDELFELSKDDRDLLRLERLAAAMLPAKGLAALKERWTVPAAAMGEALFGSFVAAANLEGKAQVELRGVEVAGGVRAATLRVRLKLHLARTETFPELDLALKGDLQWAVDEGALLSAALEGTSAFKIAQEGGAVMEAAGPMSWRYRAELLASRAAAGPVARASGAPPPPGTTLLRCTVEGKHAFPLAHLLRCTLCGKALDAERRCPDADPWPWQYCPYDGGPLQPE